MKAKKSLGQNFLVHSETIKRIVDSVIGQAKILNSKSLVEIGPGHGVLTLPLLRAGYHIIAIEKDKELATLLQTKEPSYEGRLCVLNKDLLKWSPELTQGNNLCIGNIPYNITSLIFMWLCKQRKYFQKALFMVQKEVCDRIVAAPGTKSYGRLSIKLRLLFEVSRVFDVSPKCFKPVPRVDSSIMVLTNKEFSMSSEEETLLERVTAFFFHFRRKMLRKILYEFSRDYKACSHEKLVEFFQSKKIPLTQRPELLSPEEYLSFVRYVLKKSQ
jgi:16S rRNA (adenine1518-N6/adenine1519-N6)-dimethyltransferase